MSADEWAEHFLRTFSRSFMERRRHQPVTEAFRMGRFAPDERQRAEIGWRRALGITLTPRGQGRARATGGGGMNFYDLSKRRQDEIGYDLHACLIENDVGVQPDEINRVLALVEGDNDGPPWHWVVRLGDGRVAHISGSCDYTGWDCSSAAEMTYADSPEAAASIWPSTWDYRGDEERQSVRDALLSQLRSGRRRTRREEVGEGLGL